MFILSNSYIPEDDDDESDDLDFDGLNAELEDGDLEDEEGKNIDYNFRMKLIQILIGNSRRDIFFLI